MTTKPYQFPEELIESTGAGPDFPGSSGDREKGKFRPSAIPRRTTVAVVGDDGKPVTRTAVDLLGEILEYQKAILVALMFLNEGESFLPEDTLGAIK